MLTAGSPAWRLTGFALIGLLVTASVAAIAGPTPRTVARQASPVASPVAAEAVEITGQVAHPGSYTVADFQGLSPQTVTVTLETRRGPEDHTFTGVLLYQVVELAGLLVDIEERNPLLHDYLVITAKDGHRLVISGGEISPIFGNTQMLLAWEEDGQPLTGEMGPFRLVVPGDHRGGRQTDGVIRIEVHSIDEPSS